MRILKFNVFEKLDPDWFDKNPEFYLSKSREDIKKHKDYYKDVDNKKIENEKTLKDLNINDIVWEVDRSYYKAVKPESIKDQFYFSSSPYRDEYTFYGGGSDLDTPNQYKIVLSFVNYINQKSIIIDNTSRIIVSELFKDTDYYGICYNHFGDKLFLTKDKNEFSKKIKELKEDRDTKILYHNNKVKGKELIDYESADYQKIREKLKNVKYTDIFFTKIMDKYDRLNYKPVFRNKKFNDLVKKSEIFRSFRFTSEKDKGRTYFGHLKNRYHTGTLQHQAQGIGLGYKLYKSFLKLNGYLVSDSSTSTQAMKVYINLLKDDDIYHVINDKEDKVMLIWKDYPKLEKLMRIVKTEEERSNKKFIYDDELLKYIK